MKRKHFHLDESSDQRLKAIAKRRGCSEAAVVRLALETYLALQPVPNVNPLLSMIGMSELGREDGAENHDT